MATIPIEVIVQDAESPVDPTPTPVDPADQGDNTNITVPDTGAGIVDSNSGVSSPSAAISIVSIVIAVLAIGAAIALLVRKSYKRKVDKSGMTRQEKRAMAATSTIAVLALTVLLGQLVVAGVVSPIATNAATDNETDHIDVVDKISIVVERAEDSEETIAKVTNVSYVTSTADFGYKVTASMEADVTTANLYLDGDETSEYYIAPVSNEEDGTLTANTWGYTLSEEETYLPMPLADNAAIVLQGDEKVEDEKMAIYYGVNVDKEFPTGVYKGEVEYNLLSMKPIDKLTYMQDFNILSTEDKTALLASMPEGEQYILKDIRDEKPYYISKLADGNVWMTQNLDHDIGDIASGIYTSADTDIITDWMPSSNEYTKQTSDISWIGSNTAPESYNPGTIYWNGVVVDDKTTCEEYGGTWQAWGSCKGANPVLSTGNSHYHLGNYYNWTAAVAMSDSSAYTVGQQDVNQSICPAGWTLPKSGTDLIGSGSFQYLVDRENLTAGSGGNVHISPTYLSYSSYWVDSLYDVGSSGEYWASVLYSNGGAYSLVFRANEILSTKNINGRDRGYAVRCIVR